MEKINSLDDFKQVVDVTAVACARFNALKTNLESAKSQIKTFMLANEMETYEKDGVKLLSLVKQKTTTFDEISFMQAEPEAYENWKYFRDKYTKPKLTAKLNWHNVASLFPDEKF